MALNTHYTPSRAHDPLSTHQLIVLSIKATIENVAELWIPDGAQYCLTVSVRGSGACLAVFGCACICILSLGLHAFLHHAGFACFLASCNSTVHVCVCVSPTYHLHHTPSQPLCSNQTPTITAPPVSPHTHTVEKQHGGGCSRKCVCVCR